MACARLEYSVVCVLVSHSGHHAARAAAVTARLRPRPQRPAPRRRTRRIRRRPHLLRITRLPRRARLHSNGHSRKRHELTRRRLRATHIATTKCAVTYTRALIESRAPRRRRTRWCARSWCRRRPAGRPIHLLAGSIASHRATIRRGTNRENVGNALVGGVCRQWAYDRACKDGWYARECWHGWEGWHGDVGLCSGSGGGGV